MIVVFNSGDALNYSAVIFVKLKILINCVERAVLKGFLLPYWDIYFQYCPQASGDASIEVSEQEHTVRLSPRKWGSSDEKVKR